MESPPSMIGLVGIWNFDYRLFSAIFSLNRERLVLSSGGNSCTLPKPTPNLKWLVTYLDNTCWWRLYCLYCHSATHPSPQKEITIEIAARIVKRNINNNLQPFLQYCFANKIIHILQYAKTNIRPKNILVNFFYLALVFFIKGLSVLSLPLYI